MTGALGAEFTYARSACDFLIGMDDTRAIRHYAGNRASTTTERADVVAIYRGRS